MDDTIYNQITVISLDTLKASKVDLLKLELDRGDAAVKRGFGPTESNTAYRILVGCPGRIELHWSSRPFSDKYKSHLEQEGFAVSRLGKINLAGVSIWR